MRYEEKNNYKSFFTSDHQTIRMKYDNTKPFKRIDYPELEDVAINSKCFANCPYCYVSALKSGTNFDNICYKAIEAWKTNKPYQIAIGGAGEPTLHPDFIPFLAIVKELGIVPNYTTNGMHLTDEILDATNAFCGGIALSWHPHIKKQFERAVNQLKGLKTKVNVHIIISGFRDIGQFIRIYENYQDVFDRFVLLPYQAVGRAEPQHVEESWAFLFKILTTMDLNKIALGALFYDFIKQQKYDFIDLYNPDLFSGYRIMDDSYKQLRKSSYESNVYI